LGNIRVGLVGKFFGKLRGRTGVEEVVFDRDVFVIKLLQETEWCDWLVAGT
jgi:hypothetical protein